MRFLAAYLLYGFLWLFSRLSFRIVYGISGFFFFIVYYIIPYRKKLVLRNLRNSFPDWDEGKIRLTAKKFYRHFCDTFIESMVNVFIPEKELRKRFVYANPEVCNDLFEKGRDIILMLAHYGNWEWGTMIPVFIKHKVIAVYKPLHNPHFDLMIKKSRARFGAVMVPMDKIFRKLVENRHQGERTLSYSLSDQRPRWAQIQHWLTFLNQDTPVILGPEKIARKLDMAVVFFRVIPLKRGYYRADFQLLFETLEGTHAYEVTEKYYERLENMIREKPEYWLWTHDRWKHEKHKYVQKATPLE